MKLFIDTADGVRTNVTPNFSPLQALRAAKCGATCISRFVGRLDSVGTGVTPVHRVARIAPTPTTPAKEPGEALDKYFGALMPAQHP